LQLAGQHGYELAVFQRGLREADQEETFARILLDHSDANPTLDRLVLCGNVIEFKVALLRE
jgi:hypothetical protein